MLDGFGLQRCQLGGSEERGTGGLNARHDYEEMEWKDVDMAVLYGICGRCWKGKPTPLLLEKIQCGKFDGHGTN